jgi:hypothetical protein
VQLNALGETVQTFGPEMVTETTYTVASAVAIKFEGVTDADRTFLENLARLHETSMKETEQLFMDSVRRAVAYVVGDEIPDLLPFKTRCDDVKVWVAEVGALSASQSISAVTAAPGTTGTTAAASGLHSRTLELDLELTFWMDSESQKTQDLFKAWSPTTHRNFATTLNAHLLGKLSQEMGNGFGTNQIRSALMSGVKKEVS